MKKLWGWISWQKILFALILGTVIFQNRISGGQYLSGWDNLHPEINFGLEVSRELSAVWQEFRGLGHLGGMGHAADLPRTILLWILSFAVPSNYLRWVWHMGMLALGPIGIWYIGRKLWKWNESASLTASTFYLLNLATVQYFYTPYESFSGFYGFLPWLIATFVIYLNNGSKKDLIRFAVVSLLATTAFYVQTLFVVYALVLGIISLGYFRFSWKRVLAAWAMLFAVNAFWLLPVVYFVVSNAGIVGVSKINSIASPETAYMNEAMGGWRDVLSMRGFWIEYLEWKGNDWGRLLQVWQNWMSVNTVSLLSLLLAGLSILGMVIGAIKKRISWWVLFIFGLTYFMLASNNPPFGFVYSWLIEKVPFFGEMFRSVFTKWSVVMGLIMVIGIGAMVEIVTKKKWLTNGLTILIIGISGYIVWPVLQGNLVFDSMKVEFPTEYSRLYQFFNKEDKSGRIAYLPSAWSWGWQYHDWGYRGSGFLWYGIEQPILDRAFDVWSPYNETFYNEFSTALYGCESNSQILKLNCGEQVMQVLQKYDVRYVLLDESVIAPGQDKEILRIDETKRIAEELGWKQKFQQGFLTVWDMGSTTDQFVSAPSSYTMVNGDVSKVREDVILDQVGTYISENLEGAIAYPFASLMREEVKGVEYGDNGIQITANGIQQGQELIIPGWKSGDIVRIEFRDGEAIPAYTLNGLDGPRFLGKEKPEKGKTYLVARVSEGSEWSEYLSDRKYTLPAQAGLQGVTLKVEVVGEPFRYDFEKDGQGTIGNCDVLKRGVAEKLPGSNYVAGGRGAACDYVSMTELDPRMAYLMRIQGENIEGRSLKYFLYNTGSKRNDIEWLMNKGKFDQTFSLLPWSWDGYYTLNIETRSFGQKAENKIVPVEVRWFPLEQIAGAKVITNPNFSNSQIRADNNPPLRIIEVHKTGTWLYKVKVEGSGLLKLSQGYDDGWIAPPIKHVKVDGWANGWMVDGSGEITIFYWPQLLEYLGFAMLGVTVWVLIKKRS